MEKLIIRPITESEYTVWLAAAVSGYAADKVASGAWIAEQALALSQTEHATLLPHGKDSADNHIFTILDAVDRPVGTIWCAAREKGGTRIAYVYNIEIATPFRRQGHASRALRALEVEVSRLGLSGIALHVFGHNTAAQMLYSKLGYAPTNINMYKALGDAPMPSVQAQPIR